MPCENGPAPDPRENFRAVKCTLTGEEWGAVHWAAKRAGKPMMPLAEFMRRALLEKARSVVRAEVRDGRAIPPGIAYVVTADAPRAEAPRRHGGHGGEPVF